jgi:hypothetical protein
MNTALTCKTQAVSLPGIVELKTIWLLSGCMLTSVPDVKPLGGTLSTFPHS